MNFSITDDSSIVNAQRIWLQELQSKQPKRPLLCQERRGASKWVPLDHRKNVATRTILSNELVFDFDSKIWMDNADEAKRLIEYLDSQNIPFISAWSGGKGIHIHVFFDMQSISIDSDSCDPIKEYQKEHRIDIFRIARETLFDCLLARSGLDQRKANLDRQKITWSIFTNGSVIQEFGSFREDGGYKTQLTEITNQRPIPGELPLSIPEKIELWDVSKYAPGINERIQAEILKFSEETNRSQSYNGPISNIPCFIAIIKGAEEGKRNNLAYTLGRLCNYLDVPKDEATEYLGTFAKASNLDINELNGTLKSAYLTKATGFSCRKVREIASDICDRSNCPLWQSPINATNETRKSSKEIISRSEPFIYPDGRIGYALPDIGKDCVRSLDDWKKLDPELAKPLIQLSGKLDRKFWLLPSMPDVTVDDLNLMDDIIDFVKDYVEFPDKRLYATFSAWIISTYLIENLSHAPRIIVSGPTEHGKGRVLKMASLLSYHGVYLGSPTEAVLYHLTAWERATIIIDELQDIAKSQNDLFIKIMSIFKLGFDIGALIPRMNHDNTEIDAFPTNSFWIVASKDFKFYEDQQNRSIVITMRKRTKELKPDPMTYPDALKIALELRTRLHALRLRVLTGEEDINRLIEGAKAISDSKYEEQSENEKSGNKTLELKEIELSDRTKDKVRSLLVPCLKFGHQREVLDILVDAQLRSRQDERNTFDALIFYAIEAKLGHNLQAILRKKDVKQDELKNRLKEISDSLYSKKIYVDEIRDQLIFDILETENWQSEDNDDSDQKERLDLKGQSYQKMEDKLKEKYRTKWVGNVIRNELSFHTKKGSGNRHFLTGRGFIEAFLSCRASYGSRFDAENEERN